ncbi:MAG: glyoxalase/bleomycin resistance/dioxygenase family protein [Negativicutes bacterium]|nr:glyoxalase/bleomycin resistance/dioxygenase family protein [Negativicutes bacterium]
MEFKITLLAVRDVEVSKRFYGELFEQKVVLDLGKYVTFSGGFGIQQDFAELTNIAASSVIRKSHNMELCFEVTDFDAFLRRLKSYGEIVSVHPEKKYPWQQRVVRIYDPDFHMIEIGESMMVIAQRYLGEGLSIEKTAAAIQHPIALVKLWADAMPKNSGGGEASRPLC